MSSLRIYNIGTLVTVNPISGLVETTYERILFIKDGIISDSTNDEEVPDCEIDARGGLVTPGFVDSHTHPVFLHGREEEFDLRIKGATYSEIAAHGGGIQSSINGVRSASHEELVEAVSKRMDRFLALGTTTVEAKSGYGLNLESELKSLAVLEEVNNKHPIDIIPTFLGAHAIPEEYRTRKSAYVDLLCDTMIPEIANQGIAKFCDVFCENGYFSAADSRRILTTAVDFGLIPRLHADEFEDSGAAELAGELKAISADHLMAVNDDGIAAMAKNRVIATLLPGTTFFLGSDHYAPARKLKAAGIEIALATDFNPGSCHIQSIPFILELACLYMGMTVEDAFHAVTYTAARSLKIEHLTGSLYPGFRADLVLWDLKSLVGIPYHGIDPPILMVVKNGNPVRKSQTMSC